MATVYILSPLIRQAKARGQAQRLLFSSFSPLSSSSSSSSLSCSRMSTCSYSTSPLQPPVSRHVTLPMRPSFYTGHPEYEELYYFLEDISKAVSTSPPAGLTVSSPASLPQWKSREELKSVIGFLLSPTQYQAIRAKLEALHAKHPQHATLNEFLSGFTVNLRQTKKDTTDPLAPAQPLSASTTNPLSLAPAMVGKRKSALAQVWLFPSPPPEPQKAIEPRILVNGKSLPDYFVRVKDVMMALQPLILTTRLPNYRVWCTVRGGGASGKAGAIAHGIAQSLARIEPALGPLLLEKGVLQRDTRMVERKKPGQKKARKKFTWVKR